MSSVDLRDFESIPIFFSEEEIERLQTAIDERRSRRLALEEERPLNPADCAAAPWSVYCGAPSSIPPEQPRPEPASPLRAL